MKQGRKPISGLFVFPQPGISGAKSLFALFLSMHALSGLSPDIQSD